MNSILELIKKDSHLSPETQYLSIALHLDAVKNNGNSLDVSISRLRTDFGSSPKIIAEVISFLELKKRGKSYKCSSRKKKFSFCDRSISDFMEEDFLHKNEAVCRLFMPEVRLELNELEHSTSVKLRNANLLLMAIFVLHSNEVGFVRELTNKKIRQLMGGITESRLKSQIDTLHQITFIKAMTKGGSCFAFGKFNKRYVINLDCLSSDSSDQKVLVQQSNISTEIPKKYLTFQYKRNLNFKYDFDFEFPFKMDLFLSSINYIDNRLIDRHKKQIDAFLITELKKEIFKVSESLYMLIMQKVEDLTSLVLNSFWDDLVQAKGDGDKISIVKNNVFSFDLFNVLLSEQTLFTDKYLKENEGELNITIHFLKEMILSLSVNLAISLQTLLCEKINVSGGISNVNMVLYDYHPYTRRGELGLAFRPSCNLMLSFLYNSQTIIIDMIANRMTLNESLDAERTRRIDNNEREMSDDESCYISEDYLFSNKTNYQVKKWLVCR